MDGFRSHANITEFYTLQHLGVVMNRTTINPGHSVLTDGTGFDFETASSVHAN
jgi:hypothetical protein